MQTKIKLKTYLWQGIDAKGTRVKGEVHAPNLAALKTELRRQTVTPLHIKEKSFLLTLFSEKIKIPHIVDFSRQLATLINAGVALVPALQIIGNSNLRLQTLVTAIKTKIESGSSLSEALNQYPQYFDELYRNLIYAGEQSGTLGIMLNQIANYQDKQTKLNNKIKKALLYPSAVLLTALLVTALMLIFVVPQFQMMFQNFGAELPFYTQIVIKISQIFKLYSGWILSILIIAILLIKWVKTHSPHYAYKIDLLVIKLPLIGPVITKAILARFSRTLATIFNAGVAIAEALKIIAGSCDNLVYTQAILQIREQIIAGLAMHTAISNTTVFPARVTQMVAIAEESGELAVMLNHIADFYEQEVDNAADNLSKLLEPALMIILGLVIGGLITAMYLPIFKLGNVI